LAIAPDAVVKLRPLSLTDGIVVKTLYHKTTLADNELPIVFGRIRTAHKFEGIRIIWDDD
jgi:hypothetical protein